MTPTQRAAAERLADELQRFDGTERESLRDEAAALLRELLAEPVINQQMTTELAEPVQEPVIWIQSNHLQHAKNAPYLARTGPTKLMSDFIPLYAAPQQPMHCPEDGGKCGAGGYCRPEPQGEPVAWLYESTSGSSFLHRGFTKVRFEADMRASKEYPDGHTMTPLYTHPPQQPMRCPTDGGECGAGGYCRPEQRKPLTPSMQAEVECDCLVAWNASTYGHSAQDTVHPMFLSAFLRGYRAAERAHGITGEPT